MQGAQGENLLLGMGRWYYGMRRGMGRWYYGVGRFLTWDEEGMGCSGGFGGGRHFRMALPHTNWAMFRRTNC